MFWIGIIIVLLTFIAIIKRFETRMVLFMSGLLMAIVGGMPGEVITSFTKTMVHGTLVPVICTVMGFAYSIKLTKCDSHMVHLLVGSIKGVRPLLIPLTVALTFCINIALPSAAGCAAAVGAIMIPTMISAGIHPAIAASAVMLGTFGGTLSPGAAHNPFLANLANIDVMSVIAGHATSAVVCMIVSAVGLYLVARIKGEHTGYISKDISSNDEDFKINYIKALVPVFPLILLILGSKQIAVLPTISVPQAMLAGVLVNLIVTRCNMQDLTKSFFQGMGHAYGNIIGLIAAAAVFTKGMEVIGITGSLIEMMKQSEQIASIAAGFGTMIIAILCGSGDAATLAFNGAITPHAQQFGFGITDLGSTAFLSGCFGRAMSPVAGAAIVCAEMAKIDPIEITKRNGPIMLVVAIVSMFILLY